MFERLSEGLQGAIKSLSGKGRLTEANMREGLKEVEQSLLEADVSYDVVQSFMGNVTEKALGEKVLLSLDPSEQVIGIVRDELIEILGVEDSALSLDRDVNIIMLCGLQGSGKTTTTGKLARLIRESGGKPMLVAADLQRAAAVQQLHVLGEQLDIPVYSEADSTDPVKVCQNGVKQAKANGANVVILDTAGRLAIDEELMAQLVNIDRKVQPHQVFLVVDGMTGQDAVNSAKAFNEALELDGVIMTKLDGDARGGAALSMRSVTGQPVKFVGEGEKLTDLDVFVPSRMAERILGMGDVVGLVERAAEAIDEEEAMQLAKRMDKKSFDFNDFLAQMKMMQKMIFCKNTKASQASVRNKFLRHPSHDYVTLQEAKL